MIQFNLLPDVKVEYIKASRLKRLLILAAFGAIILAVIMVLLTFSMTAVRKTHLSNLDNDIKTLQSELENVPDLAKILTVQNQLNTLPSLYDGRPAAERLPLYIDQVTPSEAGISRLDVDFSLSTIEIEGDADSLETVNKFVDALKFTRFDVVKDEQGNEGAKNTAAFSGVVLSLFSRDDKIASFTIAATFNPLIFDDKISIKLVVPDQITTRSQVKPGSDDLFNAKPEEGAAQ